MGKVQSEYDVEVKFIERLESIGYEYRTMMCSR